MQGFSKVNTLLRSILFWAGFILLLVVSGLLSSRFPGVIARCMYGVLGTIGAFLVTWIFLKNEKRSFKEIGLVWEGGTLVRFVKGLGIGGLIFILVLLFLIPLSGLELVRNTGKIDPGGYLLYATIIPLALMEEVGFRSYSFLRLNQAFGLRGTQWIVALAFALYHVLNGWDPYTAFMGPFVWAFIFGLAAAWSGGIAVPTGIHVALNAGQCIVGMKGSTAALWNLRFKDGVSLSLKNRGEAVGLGIHLAVLAATVLLTEYFIRKGRNRK